MSENNSSEGFRGALQCTGAVGLAGKWCGLTSRVLGESGVCILLSEYLVAHLYQARIASLGQPLLLCETETTTAAASDRWREGQQERGQESAGE